MILKGKNVQLRYPNLDDLDHLYKWENDQELWIYGDNQGRVSKDEIEEFINTTHDIYTEEQLRLMICLPDQKEPIGSIDLYEFNKKHGRAGIGILIYKNEYRRKGYAVEAINLMIEHCKTKMHMKQLFCHILSENKASIDLFEKCGFKKVGLKKEWRNINGTWKDEYMFQLMLD